MRLMMHHGTLVQRSSDRLGQERSKRWIHWLPGRFHRASFTAAVWLAAMSGGLFHDASAQRAGEEDESSAPTIDAATGKILNEAIELMNAEDYRGAQEAVGRLKLDRLSPYERSRVEQIMFGIAYAQEDYDAARDHLEQAIVAGGLNEQEIDQVRYQIAQLYMAEERWAEGAEALEQWFETAQSPNSAAYYLLAIAYYQQDDFEGALAPAEKAVELMERPQETWMQLLLALYLQREQFGDAVPLLERLVTVAPDKKTYWVQLSSVYGQLEDYAKALATMQLAHTAGLLTEDAEIRRLADLLMFNEIPDRGARVLEDALEKRLVTPDAELYEKLANCWIAARDYDAAIAPLEQAAELARDGNLYVRLGEVHSQREDWAAAAAALESGLARGDLRDTQNAQLLMGIALLNQERPQEARDWFERASSSERHSQTARAYIQLIDAEA